MVVQLIAVAVTTCVCWAIERLWFVSVHLVINWPATNAAVYVRTPRYCTFYSSAALLAMQSPVIPTAIPSVRLSVCLTVCPSHAGTLSRRMKIESRGIHFEVGKTP